jgi:hypothetical protein
VIHQTPRCCDQRCRRPTSTRAPAAPCRHRRRPRCS